MAYRKRLDLIQFGLPEWLRVTFAFSVVLAVGVYTNWMLGVAIPVVGLGMVSLAIRARTEVSANRLTTCGAVVLSLWLVCLAVPAFLWMLSYAVVFFGSTK